MVDEQIVLKYLSFISLHYNYILLMFFVNEYMFFSPIPTHLTVDCRLQVTEKYWWFNIRLILTHNYYRPITEDVMLYRITYKGVIMLNHYNWWRWYDNYYRAYTFYDQHQMYIKCVWIYKTKRTIQRGRHDRNRMVVGFTTTREIRFFLSIATKVVSSNPAYVTCTLYNLMW